MSTDMFSIDKLVDFGMGMAVAQQMVKTMNYAIDNMHIPNVGAANHPQMPSSSYYVAIDGQTAGPFPDGELMQLINQKKIKVEWKYCISSILGHIFPTSLKLEYILKRDGLKKKKKHI